MDEESLDLARSEIDRIDTEIAALLAQRMAAVDRIPRWKKAHGMPVAVPSREEEIIRRLRESGGEFCADEVETVYHTLFAVCRKRQEKEM